MTSEAKEKTVVDYSVEQPQVEAKVLPSPQETSKETNQAVLELPEAESEPPFAHDINYKLDELELDIQKLTDKFKSSQGSLRSAMGDLKSRTAFITEEIATVNSQLSRSDDEKRQRITELDLRLKDATLLLTEQLEVVDSQLSRHQDSILSLKSDLDSAYQVLEARVSQLQEDTQTKLQDLYRNQEQQKRTQQVFTEYLDDLQMKTNTTADELFGLQTEFIEEKRLVTSNFKLLSGVTATLIFVLASFLAYLHYGITTTETLTSKQVDTKLETMGAELVDTLASKQALEGLSGETDSKLESIQSVMLKKQEESAALQSSMNESLGDIAKKVEALQLSLYGPEEEGGIPSAEVLIHDQNWVKAQNSNHYTVQLVGVYRQSALVNFANKHVDTLQDQPLAQTISEYRGQNWHNLFYGSFATFSEAQAVLNGLPSSLQQNEPWIRLMASVQNTAK